MKLLLIRIIFFPIFLIYLVLYAIARFLKVSFTISDSFNIFAPLIFGWNYAPFSALYNTFCLIPALVQIKSFYDLGILFKDFFSLAADGTTYYSVERTKNEIESEKYKKQKESEEYQRSIELIEEDKIETRNKLSKIGLDFGFNNTTQNIKIWKAKIPLENDKAVYETYYDKNLDIFLYFKNINCKIKTKKDCLIVYPQIGNRLERIIVYKNSQTLITKTEKQIAEIEAYGNSKIKIINYKPEGAIRCEAFEKSTIVHYFKILPISDILIGLIPIYGYFYVMSGASMSSWSQSTGRKYDDTLPIMLISFPIAQPIIIVVLFVFLLSFPFFFRVRKKRKENKTHEFSLHLQKNNGKTYSTLDEEIYKFNLSFKCINLKSFNSESKSKHYFFDCAMKEEIKNWPIPLIPRDMLIYYCDNE